MNRQTVMVNVAFAKSSFAQKRAATLTLRQGHQNNTQKFKQACTTNISKMNVYCSRDQQSNVCTIKDLNI